MFDAFHVSRYSGCCTLMDSIAHRAEKCKGKSQAAMKINFHDSLP
ncbi:hypothetical protein RUMCAL_00069 [Ruminococcus callidus ATCC 27760]|uniref:Uncharacterized protein n=1 Tax=Ruminococcus callidus ATCC 27760 TaxID=411473 RepID=U2ME40_9FIRM|nr:hypothetical protein RUMCAL_00069 [Ruminococcus callidus ATCC 27760]